MSTKTGDDDYLKPKIDITSNPRIVEPGYNLQFSEQLAQEISEFVSSPLFKKLKKVYGLQAKDRVARQCLNSANNTEWLHYYKGMAAATNIFFNDLEAVRTEILKQDKESDRKQKR